MQSTEVVPQLLRYERRRNTSGKFNIYLNVDQLDIPDPDGVIEPFKTFPVETYTKVSSASSSENSESWLSNIGTVDRLFQSMSGADLGQVAMTILDMHLSIVDYFDNAGSRLQNLDGLLNMLAGKLDVLDRNINLYEQIYSYVTFAIPIGDMKNVGNRAQDTEELTFYEEDVKILLTIVVLSKMMFPVYGTFMYRLVSVKVESRLKELHCVAILKLLLDRRCPNLVKKLKGYIRHGVNNDFDEDVTSIHHGVTANQKCNLIYAKLLVRNFVNVDLYRENGKLMTFINVVIKQTIQTEFINRNKRKTMHRLDMTGGDGDDNKKAQLEVDSVVTDKPADVLIIAGCVTAPLVKSLLGDFGISKRDFQKTVNYYKRNPIEVNAISKLTVGKFLSQSIGGAKVLDIISYDDYIVLTTLTQMVMASMGYYELAHALTARTGVNVRTEPGKEEINLKLNYKSVQYKKLKNKLELSPIGGKRITREFDFYLDKIVQHVTTATFFLNTAPLVCEAVGAEIPEGGDVSIRYTDKLITQMCDFLVNVSD